MIDGFLSEPPKTASGRPVTGRFVCDGIQWTGVGEDQFGTFTITARELLAAAESGLLWTDQGVQRGVKPESQGAATELSLADGYPDEDKYIFATDNADDIADKLLYGKRLFLSPLIWNLRPGKFEGYYESEVRSFHIYSGKIYLPDSHHRHQAVIKASKIFRDSPEDYKKFSLDKQFKVELYFLTREDEGNYFFDKNQRTRQTARSKAYDLTTEDALSLLAKAVVSHSKSLSNNVNRVTDRLTSKNPQVITLSTLREMARNVISDDFISEDEIEGTAVMIAAFYDLLASVRHELGHLNAAQRHQVRKNLIVDSAVIMHGYSRLIPDFISDLSNMGSSRAYSHWLDRIKRLNLEYRFGDENWSGDLFSKNNPLWRQVGILKPNARGTGYSQVNNGATRTSAARVLKAILNSANAQTDGAVIAKSING